MESATDWPRIFASIAVILPILMLLRGVVRYTRNGWGFPAYGAGGGIEVTATALHLDGDRWNGPLPINALLLEQARVIDWKQEKEFKPSWKTFGAAWRGYRSGWFTLSGGQRALLFVRGALPVLLIPTRRDYVLMLGVEDPQQFLADLQIKRQQMSTKKIAG